MSKVRRARVRAGNKLCLRKFSWLEQKLRFSIRQSHPATIDRARADAETARDRQNGFASPFHFPQGQAVQLVSCVDRQKRRRLRIRETGAKGKKGTKAQRAPAP